MSNWNVGLMAQAAKTKFASAPVPHGASRSSFNTYLDAISGALGKALDIWRSQAVLTDVAINGPTATGGKLIGPGVDGLIRGFGPAGAWDPYTKAVASGIQNQLRGFEREVRVPGLPWYPTFAALPMPMAPPTPNVPCPLVALAGAGTRPLSETEVALAIIQKYGKAKPMCADDVAKAIASGFAMAASTWLVSTVVVTCMGSGRVPSFAPPYVPVGPVIGGTGNMPPGGLI